MGWLERWFQRGVSFRKTFTFSWTGYDATKERCRRCQVRRRDHGMMLHPFEIEEERT